VSILVAGLTLAVAIGIGAYAHRLNGRVTVLQAQLAQTRATAQATFEKVSALRIPKDFSTEIASLEVTANKLRAADDALRRSCDEQSQKIPALETRLSDAQSALAARLADAGREMKAFQEKEEARLTNIIAVLKNEDKVLHRLTETPPAPQSEE
jgi:chromosome segregation ATPase